nr:multicopper oxidase domain-containing protein [Geomicrobium sediminis]
MLLGTDDGGDTFTVNGKQFPDHEIYEVKEGDVVKVTIENDTDVDHPMHLHGEFFNVISKNGEPIQGSPVLKDTLNVRPDETYEIVFEANNPGNKQISLQIQELKL